MEPTMEAGLESAGGMKAVPGPVVQIDEGRIQAHCEFSAGLRDAWLVALLRLGIPLRSGEIEREEQCSYP